MCLLYTTQWGGDYSGHPVPAETELGTKAGKVLCHKKVFYHSRLRFFPLRLHLVIFFFVLGHLDKGRHRDGIQLAQGLKRSSLVTAALEST